MDSVPMLLKISQSIELLALLSEKASYYKRSCQSLAACFKLLNSFFEEVQENEESLLIGSASSTFERIENTLLRSKELFGRCAGQAGNFYVVLQKRQVLKDFQDLSFEMHSLLSKLPLKSFQLSDRTQEQVELCFENLHKANYFSDILEERLSEEVMCALKGIREGAKMDHEQLTHLAEKFDLRSNQEILREAAFLEKEKNSALVDKDKLEEELINLLIVLVTQMGDDLAEQKQAQTVSGGVPIPADFRCPLSLELMSDPVLVASGQTYERAYIKQWLDQGNNSCPKTRQALSDMNLIPNYTVKALITNWCETNNVPVPEPVKMDTSALQLLPSRKSDVESSQQVLGVSRAHSDQAVVAIRSRLAVRSVRTVRSRAREGLDMGGRESRESIGSFEGNDDYLQVNSASVRDMDGQYQAISSREGDHFTDGTLGHSRNTSTSSLGSSIDDVLTITNIEENSSHVSQLLIDSSPYASDASGELETLSSSSIGILPWNEKHGSPVSVTDRVSSPLGRRAGDSHLDMPRIVSSSGSDRAGDDTSNIQMRVEALVQDLHSPSLEGQRNAASEIRLLAKYNVENRIIIANCGAIRRLVSLLRSTDLHIQENAVTALLNLSINDNNKNEIAAAGAIEPLVNVLSVGTSEAKENAAATLFSLSVMDENKVAIGQSGAIGPLVDLLMHGTPRGKKDAATALFNLSILHENKARIVRANAIRPLVGLMSDPAAGMVDKAVAVLANLATIQEGRFSIGEEEGIPALVEVVELGSQRGKENAAAALLHLCTNSNRFRAKVLQEGAIPPLVALTKSGTARAKEKASALLRLFRDQRHVVIGRGGAERHADRHF